MAHAMSQVQTIEVTRAVRATEVDGLKIGEGDTIGLLDDHVVAAGSSAAEVVDAVLARLKPNSVQAVTIYAGADAPGSEQESLVGSVGRRFPNASVELLSGDQALYPYVVAVE
jgi:uncharacterized protein